MAGQENAPLYLTGKEAVEGRRETMDAKKEVKDVLAPGRTIDVKDPAIKALVKKTDFTIAFTDKDKGKASGTLNERLAQELCGETNYAALSPEQKYLVVSVEAILESNQVDPSLANTGDAFTFNFDSGTYTVDRPAGSYQEGNLKLADAAEIQNKTRDALKAELDSLENGNLLGKALEHFQDDPSSSGRLNMLKSTPALVAKINEQLSAQNQLNPKAADLGYTRSAEQNHAFLKAYLDMKRDQAPAAPEVVIPQGVMHGGGDYSSLNAKPEVPPAAPAAAPRPQDDEDYFAPDKSPKADDFKLPEDDLIIQAGTPAVAPDMEDGEVKFGKSPDDSTQKAVKEAKAEKPEKAEKAAPAPVRIAEVKPEDVKKAPNVSGGKAEERVEVALDDPRAQLKADWLIQTGLIKTLLKNPQYQKLTFEEHPWMTEENPDKVITLTNADTKKEYRIQIAVPDAKKRIPASYDDPSVTIEFYKGLNTVDFQYEPTSVNDAARYLANKLTAEPEQKERKQQVKVNETPQETPMGPILDRPSFMPGAKPIETPKAPDAPAPVQTDASKIKAAPEPKPAVEKADKDAVDKAEHQRLKDEMQGHANTPAAVERDYQAILKLDGATPDADDHEKAGQAALARGDIAAAKERFGKAKDLEPNSDAGKNLEEIDKSYKEVNWKIDLKTESIAAVPPPFAPDQIAALAVALKELQETGRFKGLVPVGDYVKSTQFKVGD